MPPPEFVRSDLTGARLERVSLRRARFRGVDLTGSVMRAVDPADPPARMPARAAGTDLGLDPTATPGCADVLEVRAQRVELVGAFLAEAGAEQLVREVPAPPWADSEQITLLQGIQVIIEEEREHQRFAERDLDRIEAGASRTPPPPHALGPMH